MPDIVKDRCGGTRTGEVPPMNDEVRLRAVALQIVATLPADQDEALRIIGHVCDVIRWRHRAAVAPQPTLTVIEGGAQSPLRNSPGSPTDRHSYRCGHRSTRPRQGDPR